jgi:hypothetical protein
MAYYHVSSHVESFLSMITPMDTRAIQLSDFVVARTAPIVVLLCAQGHIGGPIAQGEKVEKEKRGKISSVCHCDGGSEKENDISLVRR